MFFTSTRIYFIDLFFFSQFLFFIYRFFFCSFFGLFYVVFWLSFSGYNALAVAAQFGIQSESQLSLFESNELSEFLSNVEKKCSLVTRHWFLHCSRVQFCVRISKEFWVKIFRLFHDYLVTFAILISLRRKNMFWIQS